MSAPAASGLPDAAAVLAKSRLENFPVASRALPRRQRADLIALYGFARLVDDAGDEAQGDRSALLDWLEAELDAVYDGAPGHPLMRRLQPTVRAHAIPKGPFRRLIEANRRDQERHSYETFDDLLGYCRLSANPVGELVLHVFDAATPDRIRRSDAVCSGLQIAEHLQDVLQDLERGRVYLPTLDLRRFGVERDDLARQPTPRAVRALVAFEAGRARTLLREGAPLARSLPWRPGLAVLAFSSGGLAALDAIERSDHAVTWPAPRASTARRAGRLLMTAVSLLRR
ncbi:MAG: squalene synthase HpnC [Thermoleophilaceae bacterium]